MTIREDAAMLEHVPRFVEPERPDASRTWCGRRRGEELDVVDPALAASLGEDVRVIKQNRGVFDAMPLSLITTQAIAELEGWSGFALDPQRFRPNLLVEAAEREDAWVGRVLRIGGIAMRVDQRDERCVIVNIDPVDRRTRSRGAEDARARALDVHRRLRLDRAAGTGRDRRRRSSVDD